MTSRRSFIKMLGVALLAPSSVGKALAAVAAPTPTTAVIVKARQLGRNTFVSPEAVSKMALTSLRNELVMAQRFTVDYGFVTRNERANRVLYDRAILYVKPLDRSNGVRLLG